MRLDCYFDTKQGSMFHIITKRLLIIFSLSNAELLKQLRFLLKLPFRSQFRLKNIPLDLL